MRGRRCGEDFPTGAKTREGQASVGEAGKGGFIEVGALRLANWRAIPVDTDGLEVRELLCFMLWAGALAIYVLDTHIEGPALRPSVGPGQHCGAEVTQM